MRREGVSDMSLSVDGTEELRWSDTGPGAPLGSGFIGLRQMAMTTAATYTHFDVAVAPSFKTDDASRLLPPEPAAVALQAQVNASIAAGDAHLTIAQSEFFFNAGSLVLSRANGFTFVGNGSELWFSVGSGLLLHRCVNTAVVNFFIDYDPPAFFQATALADGVQDSHSKTTTVRMMSDTGFLGPHEFQRIYVRW